MASASAPVDDSPNMSENADTSHTNDGEPDSNKPKTPHSPFTFSDKPTLKEINDLQQEFIRERNWDQFHAPRNILLALVGEMGELAEIFQWKGEVEEGLPGWSEESRRHVGEEMSDVLLYLVDLATRCHVDLPAAVLDKLASNRRKYPAERVSGSARKYTEYQ